MADFNQKKLQVFVSSTFSDLIKERQAAVEAILMAGHIPAGMELFTAGDESQMEVIKQWIDESDVYVLILGARYGSIDLKSGKSYTQLEYEYAILKGKPVFACVIRDEAIDIKNRLEGKEILELTNPQKYKDFREAILAKVSEFWMDTKDIQMTIVKKLSQLSKREDLIGWVRPTSQTNLPAVTDEITRLSKENAELRSKLAGNTQEAFYGGLTFAEMKSLLEKRGLLDFMARNRQQLSYAILSDANVTELVMIGLMTHKSGGWHHLTDDGRAFLNRLEAFNLAI